jgi:hypothetical protein
MNSYVTKILTQAQITTYTLLFLILFGLLRPMVLNIKFDGTRTIMTTLVFFLWIFLSKCITYMIV